MTIPEISRTTQAATTTSWIPSLNMRAGRKGTTIRRRRQLPFAARVPALGRLGARWLRARAVAVGGGHLLTGPSRKPGPVNRSLPLSVRGDLRRARSRPRRPLIAPARVLRIAVRDHARIVALAQNPANTGAFLSESLKVQVVVQTLEAVNSCRVGRPDSASGHQQRKVLL